MRAAGPAGGWGYVAAGASFIVALTGCPNTPAPSSGPVMLAPVATGLTSPVAMAVPPDSTGRRFIVDQIGRIHVIDVADNLLATPFLDVTSLLVSLNAGGDERGLLGLAFHPQYAANGRFFVFYTAPKGPAQPAAFDSETHVSEFHVSAGDPNIADPASERILLVIGKPQSNHNGGQLAFGPDGMLYISVGDGGAGNDVGVGHTPGLGNGQDKTVLLGKLLRIDVDSGTPYGIPADNPFVGVQGVREEIWAYGLRNPWRFSFDMGGTHRLFCGDVGQNLFEEIDIIARGGNYGWNIREALHCFDPNDPAVSPASCPDVGADGMPLTDPIIEYPHVDSQGRVFGVAVVGGFVYRGSAIPGLQGEYIFGDLSAGATGNGTLFAADEQADGTWQMRQLTVTGTADGRVGRFVFGFGQDSSGQIYVLTSGNVGPTGTTGAVYRLAPAP